MAGTGLLICVSSEQQLRELTFWSMGSLAGAAWSKAASLLLCMLASGFALQLLTRNFDRLSLGEDETRHMGVNVERTKLAAIVVAALSCLLEGSPMILADVLDCTVVAPAKLPIGIVMACIGGLAFLWMLLSNAPHDSR